LYYRTCSDFNVEFEYGPAGNNSMELATFACWIYTESQQLAHQLCIKLTPKIAVI
jgi:hypothetical protein